MKSPLHPYLCRVRSIFALSYRSLAIFRIAIAGLVLTDLWDRFGDLQAHYTDWGVMPRGPMLEHFNHAWRVSLHFMSGEASVMVVLFILHAVFASMMLVGYRTRLASILTWMMSISLQSRNFMVLQGGDVLFRMALFAAMFLPLAAHYSFDRYLNRVPAPKREDHSDVSSVFLFFQVAMVYWFTSILKLSGPSFPIWWTESSAVHYALSVDHFTKPFGYFLLSLPVPVLQGMTRMAIMIEILAPFCLIMPFLHIYFRSIGILLLVLLHLGFGTSMALGPFPWVGIFIMIPFIPGGLWKREFSQLGLSFMLEEPSSDPKKVAPLPLLEKFPALTWIQRGFLSFLMVYILLWNGMESGWDLKLPMRHANFGVLLQADQKWNMFSPPMPDDGWYVVDGTLKNGARVDVYRNGTPVDWEKPRYVYKTYKNQRWRKYMMSLWLKDNKDHRLYYGKYVCRDWNRRNSGPYELNEFKLYYMREDTQPPGEPPKKAKKVKIWHHYCFKSPEELEKEKKEKEEKKKKKSKKKKASVKKEDSKETVSKKKQGD